MDARAVVERYFELALSGDAGLAEIFDRDVTWWVPDGSPLRGTHRGRDSVLALLEQAFALYDASTMSVERVLTFAEGPHVCALVHMEARTASGNEWASDYAFVFRVEGERIASVREYADTERLASTVFA